MLEAALLTNCVGLQGVRQCSSREQGQLVQRPLWIFGRSPRRGWFGLGDTLSQVARCMCAARVMAEVLIDVRGLLTIDLENARNRNVLLCESLIFTKTSQDTVHEFITRPSPSWQK